MSDKIKSIIVAAVTALLCIAIMAAGGFALFTEGVEVKGHLRAGSLDVKLYRTALTCHVLGEDGEMTKLEDKERTDFTKPTAKGVFDTSLGGENGVLMVPGSYFQADMEIVNEGDLACLFDLRIAFEGAEDENMRLAEQLTVEVSDENGTVLRTVKLSDIADGEIKIAEGLLLTPSSDEASGKSRFSVKVMLENLDTDGSENNAAMGRECGFDLMVYAVQYTENDN